MFAYVDPSVKKNLVQDGRLICLDEAGRPCSCEPDDSSPFLTMVGPVPLPVALAQDTETFLWYAWVRDSDLARIEQVVGQVRAEGPKGLFALLADHMSVNSILLYGDFRGAEAPLVRVHSNCLTGDVFGSLRCDCGPQLQAALAQIRDAGVGALVYMAGHEGRGIGLWAKAITYILQDGGHDTYQANERLGLPADSRDFSDAGRVLAYFRRPQKRVRMLGNNPMKRTALEAVGLDVEQVPLVVGVASYNVRYLVSKREHGHTIPPEALQGVTARRPGDKLG
jgi:GTP cyclohydrolase II